MLPEPSIEHHQLKEGNFKGHYTIYKHIFLLSLQLMKITIHIFIIYMLALSLVPCGDGGGGIVEITNLLFGEEYQDISDHEQHSNDCGDDPCSPFCICSCCSPALDIPTKLPFHIKFLPPIPVKASSFLSNIIHSSFHSSIWQPPKFS